uniref:Retrovirus-related Pol polyprotein from transposon TNT 1-94 n=1 Tax=Populus alba TaxID=43335 RepID=A0A4U5M9P8_POPAL|nr:hypothetical protein D5086_0000318010 [Populus alba]
MKKNRSTKTLQYQQPVPETKEIRLTIEDKIINLSNSNDSLILATLNASLTEDVLTQIISYSTSRDVWLTLERNFSSLSRAKAIQVRTQLTTIHKGSLSANAYFLSIKRLADELAFAGQPLTADDIITYVLAGLGQEYDSLASIITSRSDFVTLEELYSVLLISESRINHNNQPLQATPSVNVATRHSLPHPSSSSPIHANFHAPNHGSDFYHGRGRCSRFSPHNYGSSTSVTCQLSSSSVLISAGSLSQPLAPRQLPLISPTSPSNYLHDNYISPACNPPSSQLQNDTNQPPSLSPIQQSVLITHPMITRSKNNIYKPKILSDYHIRYPIPKALMTTLHPQNKKPTC